MTKRKKRIDPDDPLRDLERAFRKLDEEQGMVARRNARSAVFAELRRVKGWVDKTYPSKTTRKPKRKPKTVKQLEREGWITIHGFVSPRFAAAGIAPKIIKKKVEYTEVTGKTKTKTEQTTLFPAWAVEMVGANVNITTLKKAKRSVPFRKEVLMEIRFRERREAGKGPLGLRTKPKKDWLEDIKDVIKESA